MRRSKPPTGSSNAALLTRRSLLSQAGAVTLTTFGGGLAMPSLSRAADRPALTHGIQSGDVDTNSGMVWARGDREARMWVELSTTESFDQPFGKIATDLLNTTDFTGKILMTELPPGQDIFYRVTLQNLQDTSINGEPAVGRFRTAANDRRSVSFCWSGDTVGQGWGIDLDRGGMTTYATILKNQPDFFIHSGDNIYADGPLTAEVKLPDGTLWRNVVTEAKSKIAQTLDDFRGNYQYNLLDKNVLAMNREVPLLVQWDDHEVTNNWWPGEPLTRAEHQRKGYTEPAMGILAARASQAFREYTPMRFEPAEPGRVYRKIAYGPLLDVFMLDMRSYRGPNGENAQTDYGPDSYLLGPVQLAWLKRELKRSKATWKVIAADMPLGLKIVYDSARQFGSEGVAQGESGLPLGRELEIANLLSTIKHDKIHNTVWVTADVHYTAAHYYDPHQARFQDFEPFWEFVSGPLNAGTFGPGELDATFGPQLKFFKAPTKEQGQNASPAAGLQFFGHVAIDGDSGRMKVTLKDVADTALWSVTLNPKRG